MKNPVQTLLDMRGIIKVLKYHSIDSEIAAYSSIQQQLEEKYMDQWVLFHQGQLVSVYNSFDDAARDAVDRFRRGPYLIRQVGAPAVTLPAWVMSCLGFNEDTSSWPFGVISITQNSSHLIPTGLCQSEDNGFHWQEKRANAL